MIRRMFAALSLLALAATPLVAQMKEKDPDKKVDGGALPSGWTGRTDNQRAQLSDAKFVAMAPGYHVTSGPAAIYWRAANDVSGPFTASATFNQMKAPAHPEAYGMFFVGKDLLTPDQLYTYVLVRGDGKLSVKRRNGTDVRTILDWTANAAVKRQDASGKATNTLTIDASRADSVRLLVNGKQFTAIPVAHLGSTDGIVGLRVNHNLDVHVSDFTVAPRKSASAAPKAAKKVAKSKG